MLAAPCLRRFEKLLKTYIFRKCDVPVLLFCNGYIVFLFITLLSYIASNDSSADCNVLKA